MSAAHECDRCGKLFKPEKGTVTLDVNVTDDPVDRCSSWCDIDLCLDCSKGFIEFARPALSGIDL